ncbi:YdbC family protein [Priestia megaterium]|uniref:YdbC family protein n=1 Tax=Priestia megaterium TaxID=1404 RepID=UPI0021D51C5B|nr:YdbC family protein [Priestia megaterium]
MNGFIGQLGGWNVEDETDACILALWEDGTTYQEFMKHTHDSIFYKKASGSNIYEFGRFNIRSVLLHRSTLQLL